MSVDKQPEALRLADASEGHYSLSYRHPAADELRRLHEANKGWRADQKENHDIIFKMQARLNKAHAINAQLLEACIATDVWLSSGAGTGFENKVRAAIEAATDENI